MEHIRRYEKYLFLIEYDSTVVEDICIRLLDRYRDLETTVSVNRVVLRTVVVPYTHV